LGRLIDEYVKVPWGYSRCGYGCSDHASWTANGYPASIPFESTMEDINRKIHTAQDTLESAGGDASHAVKFAKLATAFVVEMAK
jgi:leucyl aminopeptidase